MSNDAIHAVCTRIVESGSTPAARHQFHQTIDKALCEIEGLGVDDCTIALQAIDALASHASKTVLDEIRTSPDPSDPDVNFAVWRTAALPDASPLDLAWHEAAAVKLRAQRRAMVSSALTELFKPGNFEAFRTAVVIPLLERSWLPSLTYEGVSGAAGRILKRADAERLSAKHAPTGPLNKESLQPALENYLLDLHNEDDVLAKAAAQYLSSALAAWRSDGEHVAIETPTLLVASSAWPLAHALDLIVEPIDGLPVDLPAAHREFESLRDAQRAAAHYLTTTVSPTRAVVFLGDYSGGYVSATPIDLTGPSAGLSLAAALIARQQSLAPRREALATGGITPDGEVLKLSGDSSLRRKGRTAGLLLQLRLSGSCASNFSCLYAAKENVDVLRDGAKESGLTPEQATDSVEVLELLDDIVGHLVEDIYKPLLDHYIKVYGQKSDLTATDVVG